MQDIAREPHNLRNGVLVAQPHRGRARCGGLDTQRRPAPSASEPTARWGFKPPCTSMRDAPNHASGTPFARARGGGGHPLEATLCHATLCLLPTGPATLCLCHPGPHNPLPPIASDAAPSRFPCPQAWARGRAVMAAFGAAILDMHGGVQALWQRQWTRLSCHLFA